MSGPRIRREVAWEYLDDGGVLACQLEEGAYWQFGPPAGRLWALIVELGDFGDVAAYMPGVVAGLTPVEARAGLEAFCETLEVMNLLEPGWRS